VTSLLQEACIDFPTQTSHRGIVSVKEFPTSQLSTINMESEDTKKVIPQYNIIFMQ